MCLSQVKPSWVRTLGPGGRFSFAKSPGQKSIRRPLSEEPADTRQGEENLPASKSTADAIPELPETHREEPEEENAERRPARLSDHSFQFAKNPGTETKYIMDEDWGMRIRQVIVGVSGGITRKTQTQKVGQTE